MITINRYRCIDLKMQMIQRRCRDSRYAVIDAVNIGRCFIDEQLDERCISASIMNNGTHTHTYGEDDPPPASIFYREISALRKRFSLVS